MWDLRDLRDLRDHRDRGDHRESLGPQAGLLVRWDHRDQPARRDRLALAEYRVKPARRGRLASRAYQETKG